MRSISFKDLPPAENTASGWPWKKENMDLPSSAFGSVCFQCPRISVVTPSYNQGSFIEETLRSVLLQEYPNLEYIVIDGGSSDKSVPVIQKYERWLSHWESESDRGQSHAINKGLAKSSGHILAYLNSDDLYLPGTLKTVSRFFSCHPDIDIIYGNCRAIDEKSRVIARWKSRPFNLYRELCRNFIYQPTSFIRRRVADRIGCFDETLHYTMDIDYWYRAGIHFKFAYISKDLACFRITSKSKTGGSRVKPVQERKKVIERFTGTCEDPHIQKNRRRILSWHHYHAGEQFHTNGETRSATEEFLQSLRLDPLAFKTVPAILALVDGRFGINFFPTANRLFAP